MQRDVAVQLADERVLLARRKVAVDDDDTGMRRGRREQRLVLGAVPLAAERLDDERRPALPARRKRAPERLDEPERVLARRDARVVEDEAEEKARRQPELRAPGALGDDGSGTASGTCTTGTGDTAARRSATKREPTQTSSTRSKARSQRCGSAPTSHHHMPMTWRPSSAAGPSSSAAPVMPAGFAQTIVTGWTASPAATAPSDGAALRNRSGATATPAARSASCT